MARAHARAPFPLAITRFFAPDWAAPRAADTAAVANIQSLLVMYSSPWRYPEKYLARMLYCFTRFPTLGLYATFSGREASQAVLSTAPDKLAFMSGFALLLMAAVCLAAPDGKKQKKEKPPDVELEVSAHRM